MEGNKGLHSIGIDLGGTFIKCGLINAEGLILHFEKVPTPTESPEAVLEVILSQIIKFVNKFSRDKPITGVGIGCPGVVFVKEGVVLNPPNLAGWESFNVLDFFKEKLELPVFIDNDANAMALAEATWGAGKEKNYIICLTLGTGVGGAIIIDRKLYHGAKGGAGELGHTIIKEGGDKCGCGNKGCLEAYLGSNYVIRKLIASLKDYPFSSLNAIYDEKNIVTPVDLLEAVKANDPLGLAIVNEMAYYLGIGIANFINTFNPEIVIIGGGLCNFGEYLLAPARKFAEEFTMEGLFEGVEIVQAKFKNQAGVIGAGSLVFSNQDTVTD